MYVNVGKGQTVNVRKKASKDSTRVGTLKHGSSVESIGTEKNYKKVSSPVYGYIESRFLQNEKINVEIKRPNSATEAYGPYTRTLRQGNQGTHVQNLQLTLIKQGSLIDYSFNTVGEADGIFGSNTFEAVIKFQKSHDLEDDGIVGRNTKDVLWRYGESIRNRMSVE